MADRQEEAASSCPVIYPGPIDGWPRRGEHRGSIREPADRSEPRALAEAGPLAEASPTSFRARGLVDRVWFREAFLQSPLRWRLAGLGRGQLAALALDAAHSEASYAKNSSNAAVSRINAQNSAIWPSAFIR